MRGFTLSALCAIGLGMLSCGDGRRISSATTASSLFTARFAPSDPLPMSEIFSQFKDFLYFQPAAVRDLDLVILVHGWGGSVADWTKPLIDNPVPYNKEIGKDRFTEVGPSFQRFFLTPRLHYSFDPDTNLSVQSWWSFLKDKGFALATFSGLRAPMATYPTKNTIHDNASIEFKEFMKAIKVFKDEYHLSFRSLTLLAHSRGGLIARNYLSDPEVVADHAYKHFPEVTKLITMATPHAGTDVVIAVKEIAEAGKQVMGYLPPIVQNSEIGKTVKKLITEYTDEQSDEIAPNSSFLSELALRESKNPRLAQLPSFTFAGTTPVLLSVFLCSENIVQGVCHNGFKRVFNVLDLPILAEITEGSGDFSVASHRAVLPPNFLKRKHFEWHIDHAEFLWDLSLMDFIEEKVLREN